MSTDHVSQLATLHAFVTCSFFEIALLLVLWMHHANSANTVVISYADNSIEVYSELNFDQLFRVACSYTFATFTECVQSGLGWLRSSMDGALRA